MSGFQYNFLKRCLFSFKSDAAHFFHLLWIWFTLVPTLYCLNYVQRDTSTLSLAIARKCWQKNNKACNLFYRFFKSEKYEGCCWEVVGKRMYQTSSWVPFSYHFRTLWFFVWKVQQLLNVALVTSSWSLDV